MCFVTPIKNRDRLALKLVGPAGEVPVAGYGGSNVDRSRDRDWHTVVQGFKIGKLIGIVFNKLGEAAEQTSSLWCLSLAPRSLFERCPGRSDRLLYVGSVGFGNLADFCASSRVDGCKGLAGFARDTVIVDQKLGWGNSNSAVRGLQHYRGHLRNSFRWSFLQHNQESNCMTRPCNHTFVADSGER